MHVSKSVRGVGPVMRRLSQYMAGARERPLPEAVAEKTKHHVLDTFAAMVSGAELLPGRMAIAFALYGAQLSWMDDATRQFLQWTSAALAGLAVAWPGRIYLRNAWSALRTRTPHMDLPIALALLAGLVGGTWMTASGRIPAVRIL